jgi:hypothetical protein
MTLLSLSLHLPSLSVANVSDTDSDTTSRHICRAAFEHVDSFAAHVGHRRLAHVKGKTVTHPCRLLPPTMTLRFEAPMYLSRAHTFDERCCCRTMSTTRCPHVWRPRELGGTAFVARDRYAIRRRMRCVSTMFGAHAHAKRRTFILGRRLHPRMRHECRPDVTARRNRTR